MTLVVTILIGAGAVLISSAIDCSNIADTFVKIINNQSIDWTGNACQGTGTTPTASAPATIGAGNQGRLVPPLSNGRCAPPGVPVYVSGGKLMCELPAVPSVPGSPKIT